MEPINVKANEIASVIASRIDIETKNVLQGRNEIDFKIIGDTVFTRAIKRKFDKLGIKCFDSGNVYSGFSCPYIIDIETEKKLLEFSWALPYNSANDIDCCQRDNQNYMTSCVSEACCEIIISMPDYHYSHIGIVGRGHAVLGLSQRLIQKNYTVTQCHSKTKDLNSALAACDIIVYAAPIWNAFDMDNRIVLDVSYCIPKELNNPKLVTNIGTVNTSIVALRAAKQYMNLKNKYKQNWNNCKMVNDPLIVPC